MPHDRITLIIAIGVALIAAFWPYFSIWSRLAMLVVAAGIALDSSILGMLGLVLVLLAAVHGFTQARRRGQPGTTG
jgi:hypothetical protein